MCKHECGCGYKPYKILENKQIANEVYELTVQNNDDIIESGQFYMLKVEGKFLARPITVCKSDVKTITFVYKTFGEGTKELSTYKDSLEMLGPQGHGWKTETNKKIVLVAGGVGTPAIYKIATELATNNELQIVLGFKGAKDVFYEAEFAKLGKTFIMTDDGTQGEQGNVVDKLKQLDFDYIYACGPNPMLKAIAKEIDVDGQVSLEEHMASGIGICGSCSSSILKPMRNKRVCTDGPVFDIRDINV